jgi:hypothetical protein
MNTTLGRASLAIAAVFTLFTGACASGVPASWEDPSVTEPAVVKLPASRGTEIAPGTCLPRIGTTGAWLAADGGRSIPLPNGTAIHLFGDTLLQPAGSAPPASYDFVGNSIGLASCSDGEYSIDYLWRDAGGKHKAFFDLGVEGVRLWPSDGIFLGGRLYVVLSKVSATDQGFGFECGGMVWATVENPLDPPLTWRITYQDLSGTDGFLPDKGLIVEGDYVYLFSSLLGGNYPLPAGLFRIPRAGLGAPREHLEYLSADGRWAPAAGFDHDAKVVVAETSPNMYVHYHEGLGRFMTVHAGAAFGSRDMVIQTAEHLEGPWTEGTPVYQFPEMAKSRADGLTVICYAVTEHPQLRRDHGNTIVVTYACNTVDGPLPSFDDLDLYYPKTVTIDLGKLQNELGGGGR